MEQSLFDVLSSFKMTDMLLGMLIISIEKSEQVRWLSAHAHELVKNNWRDRSMSKQFDITEKAFQDIIEYPSSFTDELFVMDVFSAAAYSIEEF